MISEWSWQYQGLSTRVINQVLKQWSYHCLSFSHQCIIKEVPHVNIISFHKSKISQMWERLQWFPLTIQQVIKFLVFFLFVRRWRGTQTRSGSWRPREPRTHPWLSIRGQRSSLLKPRVSWGQAAGWSSHLRGGGRQLGSHLWHAWSHPSGYTMRLGYWCGDATGGVAGGHRLKYTATQTVTVKSLI